MSISVSGAQNYTFLSHHYASRYPQNTAGRGTVDFKDVSKAVAVSGDRSTILAKNQMITGRGERMDYLTWASEETGHKLLAVGGNASMDYRMWYAQESTEDNPVITVDGITKGERFERKLYLNDVSPYNATYLEMEALKKHYKLKDKDVYGSFPHSEELGPDERMDFIAAFKEEIAMHLANNFQQWASECKRSLECYLTVPQKAWPSSEHQRDYTD